MEVDNMCSPKPIVDTLSEQERLKIKQNILEKQQANEYQSFDVKPAKDDFKIIKETRFTNR